MEAAKIEDAQQGLKKIDSILYLNCPGYEIPSEPETLDDQCARIIAGIHSLSRFRLEVAAERDRAMLQILTLRKKLQYFQTTL